MKIMLCQERKRQTGKEQAEESAVSGSKSSRSRRNNNDLDNSERKKEPVSFCVCESESVCVCVCVSPSLCVCVSVYLSVLTPPPNPRKLEGPCPPRRPTTLFPYLPSHMLHPSSVCSHPVCLSVCPYTTSMTGIVLLASLF